MEGANSEHLRREAKLFAALGDSMRLEILQRLGRVDSLSITSLREGVQVTRQAVTKHLEILEDVELVQSSRVGRERLFSLNRATCLQARQTLDLIAEQWEDALDRLRHHVEDVH